MAGDVDQWKKHLLQARGLELSPLNHLKDFCSAVSDKINKHKNKS